MKIITVLKSFKEQRTGRAYQPGERITDPQWHQAESRKAEAYAARGLVRVEDVPDAPLAAPVVAAPAAEGGE
jgi:hypothetical protein